MSSAPTAIAGLILWCVRNNLILSNCTCDSLQGVSKGVVVEELLAMMALKSAAPDFVLCVGDDRSDEDMFESIASVTARSGLAEVFACTVGQKPSKAKYYLDDIAEVIKFLQGLAAASDPAATPPSLPSATSSQNSLETSLHI